MNTNQEGVGGGTRGRDGWTDQSLKTNVCVKYLVVSGDLLLP